MFWNIFNTLKTARLYTKKKIHFLNIGTQFLCIEKKVVPKRIPIYLILIQQQKKVTKLVQVTKTRSQNEVGKKNWTLC